MSMRMACGCSGLIGALSLERDMAWDRRMIEESEFSKTWKVTNLRLYPHQAALVLNR